MVIFTDLVKFQDEVYLSEWQLRVCKLNHYYLVVFNMVLATVFIVSL